MEIFESIGFINYWGVSPRFDLLKHIPEKEREDESKPINIFLSASSDIGHILKTTADNRSKKVCYFLHEK